jgi:hypothetical protein
LEYKIQEELKRTSFDGLLLVVTLVVVAVVGGVVIVDTLVGDEADRELLVVGTVAIVVVGVEIEAFVKSAQSSSRERGLKVRLSRTTVAEVLVFGEKVGVVVEDSGAQTWRG